MGSVERTSLAICFIFPARRGPSKAVPMSFLVVEVTLAVGSKPVPFFLSFVPSIRLFVSSQCAETHVYPVVDWIVPHLKSLAWK